MMFKILDGRESFYQWDIDRKLIVENESIKEVHFCNCSDSNSIVCETYQENGLTLVNVPNILLQQIWNINVYGYATTDDHTRYGTLFNVIPRSKPADYVYTETEIQTWDKLEKRIEALEQGGGGGGGTYIAEPEIYVGEEEPTGSELIWINPNGDEITELVTMEAVEAKGYQTEAQVSALIAAALTEVENGSY